MSSSVTERPAVPADLIEATPERNGLLEWILASPMIVFLLWAWVGLFAWLSPIPWYWLDALVWAAVFALLIVLPLMLGAWLVLLEKARSRWVGPLSLAGTLAAGLAMTLALVVAGFSWFGLAIGHFTGLGPAVGLALLVLVAPLLQPQVLVWALLRRAVGWHHGPALGALAAAAGWVGTEWLLLKPLGDTLGHGLYPSTLLCQAAT